MTQPAAFERVADRLAEVTGYRPAADRGDWRCPGPGHAAGDRRPSLSVTRADDRVLVHCQAGCELDDVLASLQLTPGDLFDAPHTNGTNGAGRRSIVATYDYTDETGRLLFQAVRWSPKAFTQRRPDGSGGWVNNLGGARRVLYRLPRILQAVESGAMIFVVEGEKDVEALERAGEVATCNPMGAGKWRPEFAEALIGAEKVVVVVDRDPAGRKHALAVARSLSGRVGEVLIAEPLEGKDVSDHLAAGHTVDELDVISIEQLEAGVRVDQLPSSEVTAPQPQEDTKPSLEVLSLAELIRQVSEAPAPRFLARPIWPEQTYGIIAAEDKAGKTWAILDFGLSVAAGHEWLGKYQCETPGPVLLFLGEGGQRKMHRRLQAVAESKGIDLDQLAAAGMLRVCFRVPHLKSIAHLAEIRRELEAHPAALTIVDPLYLAARGAKGSDLYEMGEHLENVQLVTQAAGSALAVVTHFNKTGDGKGSKRISGVGPGAWGRVLATAHIESRNVDANGMTTVVLGWQFRGDEIPDTDLHVTRWVWADDPDDLASPMHYRIEAAAPAIEQGQFPPGLDLRPSARRVLAVLRDGNGMTVRDVGDELAKAGRPLKARTIQDSLAALRDKGLAGEDPTGPGGAYVWRAHDPATTEETEKCL